MILTIHFMDGHHIELEFGVPKSPYHSWRVSERTLIVAGPLGGNRIEYPLINVRALEITTTASKIKDTDE